MDISEKAQKQVVVVAQLIGTKYSLAPVLAHDYILQLNSGHAAQYLDLLIADVLSIQADLAA